MSGARAALTRSSCDCVRLESLSPRERDILERIAKGHTSAEIARQLFISEKPRAITSRTYSKNRV